MRRLVIAALLLASVVAPAWAGVKVADLGRFDGVRDNQLIGYGLVTGLAGTGDSQRNRATRQSISNMLSQFDVVMPKDQISSRNVAAVMVLATLPPYARVGDKIDVTVTSIGDARSLAGGTLLLAPMKGPDNVVHALAQGPLSIGGYRFDLNGNVVQKNHPTVGLVSGGANVEVGVKPIQLGNGTALTYLLAQPDYTTAVRIAKRINDVVGARIKARVRDAGAVEIGSADEVIQSDAAQLLMTIENLEVEPGERARVVVNERTGTVISGGDVQISKVTITHGDLKVSITTDYLVSQPVGGRQMGPDVRTQVVPHTTIGVDEGQAEPTVVQASNTVSELIRTLNKIKTSPRDMIAILQGIKAAGALHAELIIQ